jgi:hypothetical protein
MPEGEAQMSKRSLLSTLVGLAGALVLAPLLPRLALAAHDPKLKEMIDKADHAGLAEYYKKQAEEARHNAAGMKDMASEYLKKFPKNTYAKHCEKMEKRYLEQAKEFEELAEQHSKAGKQK